MVYVVMDWHNNPHSLTAKQLYERIKQDSKSNYNWLASAAELTRVTGRPFFNDDYAIGIRAMILNCFASLEHQKNCGGGGSSTREVDKQAIQECYNSLYKVDNEEAIQARKLYLIEIVDATTRAEDCFDFIAHPGKSFHDFHDEWVKTKCLEYFEKDFIDFEGLYKTLRPEWLRLKKEAEERGDFVEADKAAREELFGRTYRHATRDIEE